MAPRPVAYRKAECCEHCRSRRLEMEGSFWKRTAVVRCKYRVGATLATYRCSRFRWAEEHRPPKPEEVSHASDT
jgi:hypothetical protein